MSIAINQGYIKTDYNFTENFFSKKAIIRNIDELGIVLNAALKLKLKLNVVAINKELGRFYLVVSQFVSKLVNLPPVFSDERGLFVVWPAFDQIVI